jgi:hypothetical protein
MRAASLLGPRHMKLVIDAKGDVVAPCQTSLGRCVTIFWGDLQLACPPCCGQAGARKDALASI